MEKEKILEIKIERMNDEYSVWCITYQNEEILKRGEFIDKELGVHSSLCPSFGIFEKVLYIKGIDGSSDNIVNIIPNYLVGRLKEIVNAVNEKYGIPKRWRADENSKYYFFGSRMDILSNSELYDTIDNERYKLGNYFETPEEAEKVKRKLQEFWAKVRAGEIGK